MLLETCTEVDPVCEIILCLPTVDKSFGAFSIAKFNCRVMSQITLGLVQVPPFS